MTFNDRKNNITKRPVDHAVITLDYCARTFGVSPCLATGTKCYNTYPTCTYKEAFSKTTKDYELCSNNAPLSAAAELNARPLLKNITYLPTELHEDKTIPARSTIIILDEPDYDVGIDPYLGDRVTNILDTPGTFVKKLLARNPNYKGRPVVIKQGFEGLSKADYVQRFRGKIESLKRSGNTASIECIDLLKSLDDYKYPIRLDAKITEDMGAFFEVENTEEMLALTNARLNDYAVRKDFDFFVVSVAGGSSEITADYSYYRVVAFSVADDPIATSDLLKVGYVTGNEVLDFSWSAVTGASYYRIYGPTETLETYQQTSSTSVSKVVNSVFSAAGTPPEEAYRLLKLTLEDPTSRNAWTPDFTSLDLGITDTSRLDSAGYFQVDKEICSYTSKDAANVYGVHRARGGTKGDARHYAGTNIAAVIGESAKNPYDILTSLFYKADITTDFYEAAKIAAYKAAYTGINFSTPPIFYETTLGKLVADLMNMLDGKIWQNENGKLDIKLNSDSTVSYTITDALNIIVNSTGVDDSIDEIKTRIVLYYDRDDATKNEKQNFKGAWVELNADDESSLMFNAEFKQEMLTTWINSDCGTETEIKNYISGILNAKIKRKHVPRPVLQCDLEIKDCDILVGELVYLDSDEFNNIDGTDYSSQVFEVVKKEFKNSRVTLWVQYWPTAAVTTTNEDHTGELENPIPVVKQSHNEILVTGLKYIDDNGVEYTDAQITTANVSNRVKLKWDNMYMSEEENATDILGFTRQLALREIYIGYPPALYDQEVDLSSWKTVRQYNVYMFVPYAEGEIDPVTSRPTSIDANGKWYKIAIIPDLKVNDAAKKYLFEYTLPPSLIGKCVCFDVYADARIVYDPDAPVGISVEVMQ